MAASKDLAEILSKLDPFKYAQIIERAALNGYHDHKFDKIPGHPEYAETVCPKFKLMQDLSKFPELNEISQQVIQGKFDDAPDSEDKKDMRGWLIDIDAPDAMFIALGFKVPTKEEVEQRNKQKLMN